MCNLSIYAILCCLVFMTSELAALNSIGRFSNQNAELRSPFTEYFVRKWITSIAEASTEKLANNTYSLTEQENDISNIIKDINTSLDGNIFIKSGDVIRINYGDFLGSIKHRGRQIIDQTLGKRDFMLTMISQLALNDYLDNYFSQFEDIIKVANFSSNIETRNRRISATTPSLTDITRKFIKDVLLLLFKPLQVLVNDSIINTINTLMTYYQPLEPPGFFQSIFTSIINRVILLVVDFLDMQRTAISNIFVTSPQPGTKSLFESEHSENSESKSTRSIIDAIVAPVNFLLAIVFTPLNAILTIVTNIVFTFLRPVFRGTILGDIEGIVRRIISLIPCIRCPPLL